MSNKQSKDRIRCSFCGRDDNEAPEMIGSPTGVYICAECVDICRNMIHEKGGEGKVTKGKGDEAGKPTPIPELTVPRPNEIKGYMDDYVVGQDGVKKVLSVAVHNHYKRTQYARRGEGEASGVEIEKSNIMLVGPTGCGKTLLARTLAQKLDVPFALTDATTLTEAGYVGEDVENILLRLVQAADYDLAKAQVGIIYVDEIDKIARRTENVSITRDVSGEGVQQALLKILEGTVANIPPKGGRKHPQQEYLRLDTSNILFICAGAFVGLDQVVRRRVGKRVLGFSGQNQEEADQSERFAGNDILELVEPEDLLKFGLIPEFVGRIPVVATLKELSEDDLIEVLTKPRNSLLKQYQALFGMEGVALNFTDDALRALASLAKKRGTGARGLRAILESLMVEVMYEVPSRKDVASCTITDAAVLGKDKPDLRLKSAKRKKSA